MKRPLIALVVASLLMVALPSAAAGWANGKVAPKIDAQSYCYLNVDSFFRVYPDPDFGKPTYISTNVTEQVKLTSAALKNGYVLYSPGQYVTSLTFTLSNKWGDSAPVTITCP